MSRITGTGREAARRAAIRAVIAACTLSLAVEESRAAIVEYFPNSGLLQLDNTGINYVPTLGSLDVYIQQWPASISLNTLSDWTSATYNTNTTKHIEWAGNIGNSSDELAAGVYSLTTLPTNWGNANFGNSLDYRGVTYNQGPNNTQGAVLFGDIQGQGGPATAASTVQIERAVPSENDWTGPAGGAWSAAGNWTLAASPSVNRVPIPTDTASFINPALAGTISFSGSQTAANLWFNSASPYTIGTSAGSVLSLSSSAVIWIDAGLHSVAAPLALAGSLTVDAEPAPIVSSASAGVTLSSRITGNGALVKMGPGVLVLANSANNNSYSGNTVISAGTLSLANDGNFGAGTTISLGNATLDFSAPTSSSRSIVLASAGSTIQADSGTVVLSGPFSGSGGWTKAGAGTVAISNAASSFTGGTTIAAGTLQLLASSVLSTTGVVTIAGGAVLDLNAKNQSLNQILGGGTVLNKSNSSISTLTAAYVVGGATYSAAIQDGSGKTALSVPGGGKLLLTNTANTFSGGASISGGTVSVSADGNLGQGTVAINGGAVQATSSFTSNAGRPFALTGAADFDVAAANTLTIAGVIGGSGTLDKTNSGRLTLTAGNHYAGGTVINGGAVAFPQDAALGAAGAPVTINNGALELLSGATVARPIVLNSQNNSALQVDSGTFTATGLISGSGALSLQGSGSFILTNTGNSYSGGTFVNGGTLVVNDPTGTVLAGGTNSIFLNAAGQLSGTGLVSPPVRLTGGNIAPGFGSPVGTLALANGLSVTSGSLTFRLTNATDLFGSLLCDKLDLSGGTAGLSFVNGSARAPVNLAGAPLPTAGSNYTLITGDYGHMGSSTFLSTITTQFPLVCPLGYSGQWGVQAQIPGGLGTYANYYVTLTGPTEWQGSGGSLSDGAHWTNSAPGNPGGIGLFGGMGDGSLSSGTISVSVPGSGYGLHGLIFSDTAASYVLTPTGSGAISLTGVYSGGGYSGDGEVEVVSGSHSITAPVILANNTDVTMYDPAVRFTFAGVISGSGALNLTGSGTLILSGSNNSFTGGVEVSNATTLLVKYPGSLADNVSLTVGDPTLFASQAPIALEVPAAAAVSPVPEPGALSLLAAACAGFFVLRRSRRQRPNRLERKQ